MRSAIGGYWRAADEEPSDGRELSNATECPMSKEEKSEHEGVIA